MPTPRKGARLGGSPAHQKLVLVSLATQLVEHRALATTEAKAKALRPYFEKLATRAKRGDLYVRQTVAKKITLKGAAYMLSDEIVPKLNPERNDGYTHLIRAGNRRDDDAPLVCIEIVSEKVEKRAAVKATETTIAKAAEKVEEPAKDEAARVESIEVKAPEVE